MARLSRRVSTCRGEVVMTFARVAGACLTATRFRHRSVTFLASLADDSRARMSGYRTTSPSDEETHPASLHRSAPGPEGAAPGAAVRVEELAAPAHQGRAQPEPSREARRKPPVWPTDIAGQPNTWPQPTATEPIVYKVDLRVGSHTFTTSTVLPFDDGGKPTESFDATGKRSAAGTVRTLPASTIYGFNESVVIYRGSVTASVSTSPTATTWRDEDHAMMFGWDMTPQRDARTGAPAGARSGRLAARQLNFPMSWYSR